MKSRSCPESLHRKIKDLDADCFYTGPWCLEEEEIIILCYFHQGQTSAVNIRVQRKPKNPKTPKKVLHWKQSAWNWGYWGWLISDLHGLGKRSIHLHIHLLYTDCKVNTVKYGTNFPGVKHLSRGFQMTRLNLLVVYIHAWPLYSQMKSNNSSQSHSYGTDSAVMPMTELFILLLNAWQSWKRKFSLTL